jgi:predicted AAA+ superfamily ATPase
VIRRRAFERVQSALERQAAVALIGPRQVGKTTEAALAAEEAERAAKEAALARVAELEALLRKRRR